MNKKDKFLRQLTEKERGAIDEVIVHILAGATSGLDIKKLKGKVGVYRVRIGRIRVIYKQTENVNLILRTEFKGKDTYTF